MIDLHTHSHFSDGSLSPTELLTKAKSVGIKQIALTDHDTISGLSEAIVAAKALGLGFIPGIEFTVCWRKYDLHILGLNIDVESPELIETVEKHLIVRKERANQIALKLESVGVENALEEAKKHAHSNELTRPHFAKVLIEQKKVKDMGGAFRQYLGRGKVAYVRAPWSSLQHILQVIKKAKGLSVIAHPLRYKLTRTKLLELIADFKAGGGDGMEVISGVCSVQEKEQLLTLCRTQQLLASVGSDFHSADITPYCFGRLPSLTSDLDYVWQHF